MRFEDFRIMIELINIEEQEILNAGLTPCSHTTTTKVLRTCLFLRYVLILSSLSLSLVTRCLPSKCCLLSLNTLPGVSIQDNY